MFLWVMVFSIISSGVVAMEPGRPDIYIKNQNKYSLTRSAGVLAKINEGQVDARLVFVPFLTKTENPKDAPLRFLGQWKENIDTLTLQPSTAGTGKTGSYVFSPESFSLTDVLNNKIKNEQNEHSDEDILIVVDNNKSYVGQWDIQIKWLEKPSAESMPIAPSIEQSLKESYEEYKKTPEYEKLKKEQKEW